MNPIIFESLLPLKKHIAILVHELIIARTVQSNPSNANIETCVFFFFQSRSHGSLETSCQTRL